MPDLTPFESKIKESFHHAADELTASAALENRIKYSITRESRKETSIMTHKFFKKVAVTAVVFCMATVSVLGAGKVKSIVGFSKSTPTYTSIPSDKELEKTLGVVPNIPEKFSDSYLFQSATIIENEDHDDADNVLKKYKSLSINYTKASADAYLSLYISDSKNSHNDDTKPEDEKSYHNTTMAYSTSAIKFVPVDYQLTDQDKADQESGKYEISYGTDEVTTSNYQTVSWTIDSITYNLTACNLDLTKENMFEMVESTLK